MNEQKEISIRSIDGMFETKPLPKTRDERFGAILSQLDDIVPKLHEITNPYLMEIVYKCKQILGGLNDPHYIREKAIKILNECKNGWDNAKYEWKDK